MQLLTAVCITQLSVLCVTQRDTLIGTIIALAALSAFMAGWQRHAGSGGKALRSEALTPQNVLLTLLRATSSLAAFTILALFTTPALTCIFRDYSRTGIRTKIPDWLQRYALESTAVGLSVLAAAVPGLVTLPVAGEA